MKKILKGKELERWLKTEHGEKIKKLIETDRMCQLDVCQYTHHDGSRCGGKIVGRVALIEPDDVVPWKILITGVRSYSFMREGCYCEKCLVSYEDKEDEPQGFTLRLHPSEIKL